MDSKGWLLIDLIASFNRVKQLTEKTQLVRDVLSLSSIVEMRENYVRLRNEQWKNYVLPDAATSPFEDESDSAHKINAGHASGDNVVGDNERQHQDDSGDGDKEEDEDEDDVVFVMG